MLLLGDTNSSRKIFPFSEQPFHPLFHLVHNSYLFLMCDAFLALINKSFRTRALGSSYRWSRLLYILFPGVVVGALYSCAITGTKSEITYLDKIDLWKTVTFLSHYNLLLGNCGRQERLHS